ncbi:hypothetical protein BGZ79_006412 [Entomortierella chlamydospora]|nr:hypothetical protein BGZ79_006412 [Entomortierella chlamydospora]
MTTVPGAAAAPYCFCFKPAITIHTAQHGPIYECHYTDLSLWLDLQTEAPQKNDIESSPSSQTQSSSVRSTPNSPQSPITRKAHDAIQNIVTSFKEIEMVTNTPLPTTWNPSLERVATTNKISIGIINPQPIVRQKSPAIRPSPKLVRPSNARQKIVCGFHMHADLWETFKSLARKLERDRREKKINRRKKEYEQRGQEYDGGGSVWWGDMSVSKQDTVLARWHHEIVIRHSSLYSKFRIFAEKNQCRLNIQTIGRWTNYGEDILGGKTSPLGGAPHCACGMAMKLSRLYQGQEWSVAYFCAPRLADAKRGCSRVMNAGKWVQWQDMNPSHPVLRSNWDQVNEYPTTNDVVDSDKDFSSDDEMSSSENRDEEHEAMDDMSSEETNSSENYGSDEIPWDNASSQHTRCKLKTISLPNGLETRMRRVNGDDGDDRNDNDGKDDQNPWLSDDFDNPSPWSQSTLWSQPTPWSQSTPRSQSTVVPDLAHDVEALVDRLKHVDRVLVQAEADERIKERENNLSEVMESCVRMKEYVEGQYVEGLDNPTLRCRVCKEGSLMCANVPCFHLVMCNRCIKDYAQCAVCNSRIEGSQRIFWG